MSDPNPDPRAKADAYRNGEADPPADVQPQSRPGRRSPEQWSDLISQRIEEAMRDGHFDNLRGKGKPLNPAPDPHIPPDMQMANSLLKNNELVPAWISDRNAVLAAVEAIAGDLDLRLTGPNNVAAGSASSSDDNEQIRVAMAPATGTYVLEVYGYQDAENTYRLNLDVQNPMVVCDADRVEPNDSRADAEPLRPEVYTNLTQCGDPDWYKTEVPEGSTLQVYISYTGNAPSAQAFTPGGQGIPGQSYGVGMGDGCRANRPGCRLLTAPGPVGGGFIHYNIEAGTLGQAYDLVVRVQQAAAGGQCGRANQACDEFEICDYGTSACTDAFCDANGVGCPNGFNCHQEWCTEACIAGACAHPDHTCKYLDGEFWCGLGGNAALGDACFDFSDCSRDFDCLVGASVPGGYCTRECTRDSDCGPGGACARFDNGNFCGDTCAAQNECRQGYGCNTHPRAEGGGNVRMCTPGIQI